MTEVKAEVEKTKPESLKEKYTNNRRPGCFHQNREVGNGETMKRLGKRWVGFLRFHSFKLFLYILLERYEMVNMYKGLHIYVIEPIYCT